MRHLLIVASLTAVVAACGDDVSSSTTGSGGSATGGSGAGGSATGGSGAGGSATGGEGGTGGTGGSGGAAACDDAPFVAEAEDAGPFQGIFQYLAQSTLGTPVDVLSFQLVGGAPGAPTTIQLTDAGYESCTTCVLLYRACDQNLANCQQTFLAQGGTLDITSTGGSGDTFAGTLTDVQLVEVDIDPSTFVSTPVAGGESLCWTSYGFSATIQ